MNTIDHVREEGELLVGRIELPPVRTNFRDRHALIVVRGTTYRRDLRTLRAYIEDTRPVLVGVDGGADAILEEGFTPDMVLGDMDSATDAALTCGAEVVVHAYADGRAPGLRAPRAARPRPGGRRRRSAPARTSRCCSRTRTAPS